MQAASCLTHVADPRGFASGTEASQVESPPTGLDQFEFVAISSSSRAPVLLAGHKPMEAIRPVFPSICREQYGNELHVRALYCEHGEVPDYR